MEKTFEIGKVEATEAVWDLMGSSTDFKSFVSLCLSRYILYDWGGTLPEYWKLNDEAVRNGGKVIAVFMIPEEIENTFEDQLWFITEADRSKTLMLFQSDY